MSEACEHGSWMSDHVAGFGDFRYCLNPDCQAVNARERFSVYVAVHYFGLPFEDALMALEVEHGQRVSMPASSRPLSGADRHHHEAEDAVERQELHQSRADVPDVRMDSAYASEGTSADPGIGDRGGPGARPGVRGFHLRRRP